MPSSQICSSCLSPTGKKPLNIRKFTCPVCGTVHDRDNNAAKVIEYYGLLQFYELGLQHNLSAGTVDYTRGEPSSGDSFSIFIEKLSSYGSMKREALTS